MRRAEAHRIRKAAERADFLEARIAQLEHQLALLTHELEEASTAQQFDKVRQLGLEYKEMEKDLDKLLFEWARVADNDEP